MNKIALVTTHNTSNYGATLQTYAMQRCLEKHGMVTVINYENRHISNSLDYIRIKFSVHGALGTVKDITRLFPRVRAINKFKNFINTNLNLSPKYTRACLDTGQADDYHIYVSGSDQIWNPHCMSSVKKLDPIYFSSFAKQGKRKISYASSWGGYKFNGVEKEELRHLLKDFYKISVREKDSQLYLNNLLSKPVTHSIDPTLLLDQKEWRKVCDVDPKSINRGKYILVYSVPKLPFLLQCVKHMAKELKLPIIVLDQSPFNRIKNSTQIRDAGPVDFLNLFSNAEFVVTDSFHGVCFSVNFEIPFITTSNPPHSNRIESLLNILELQERIIKDTTELSKVKPDVDFKTAKRRLKVLRRENIEYLETALNLT